MSQFDKHLARMLRFHYHSTLKRNRSRKENLIELR